MALRAKALEALLVEKGVLSSDTVDALVKTYEQDIGPLNGVRWLLGHGSILPTRDDYLRMVLKQLEKWDLGV